MPVKMEIKSRTSSERQLFSADALRERYLSVRQATEELCAPLQAEDCVVQSMPDASPTKWHLAHTTWFFETFALKPACDTYRVFDPQFNYLFNSYYNLVGARHLRLNRGVLSRPTLVEIIAYRRFVDREIAKGLNRGEASELTKLIPIIELGLHHEQQHQELILTDIKHAFSRNPIRPAYKERQSLESATTTHEWTWLENQGGQFQIGHEGDGFCYDNEMPKHDVILQAFRLASRLVTNAEYLSFMADEGYARPELWMSDGWDLVQKEKWVAPLYWEKSDEGWQTMTLSGMYKVRGEEPVCHVSYYEADAFSRWAGARLPSEAEWEVSATEEAVTGNFLESGVLHPTADANRTQRFGDVWEWTQSAYGPYPGYQAPKGALGEYNGKFMSNQMVLRGGSCVSPQSHMRATYRNFFYPHQRWQFTGIRLAQDV